MKLPKPPSADAFGEVLGLLHEFSRGLEQHTQGTPDADGLLQMVRPRQLKFRKEIWLSAPDFRPFMRQDSATVDDPAPLLDFLAGEEDESTLKSTVEKKAIYLDDVWTYAQK